MKLGNHGWGMRDMIIYMCVLILILFFVAFSINALYRRIAKDNNANKNNTIYVEPEPEQPIYTEPEVTVPEQRTTDFAYYHELEGKIYNATHMYLKEKPTELNGGILKIDAETLINLGYLEELYNDNKSSKCTGYSNVYVDEESNTYTVKSYIRCDNYSSDGY